jgi:hypothetical protein
MVIGKLFITALIAAVFLILSGCATQTPSNIHPYTEMGLFQAPIININNYKSVHRRPENLADLAAVVAISGGGERAANLGLGVLAGLESIKLSKSGRNALQEIDYFSTVSGGGMAAATYFSGLYSHLNYYGAESNRSFSFKKALNSSGENVKTGCKKRNVNAYYSTFDRSKQIVDPCLRRHLARDYQNNLVKTLMSPRMLFTRLDRGDILESAFSKEVLGGQWNHYNLRLGDLFVSKNSSKRPQYPQWAANATVYENGVIFPYTPQILAEYKISGYIHDLRVVDKGAEDYIEFASNVPLSLGLTASGNFPTLIAPQTLESDHDNNNQFIHLIDGGMSDNLGLTTAMSILDQEEKNRHKRKVVIVIDAFSDSFSPYSKYQHGPLATQVYTQLPDMPLNGQRGGIKERLQLFEQGTGTKVFYLSFDDLYCRGGHDPHIEDAVCAQKLFEQLDAFYLNDENAIKQSSTLKIQRRNEGKTPFEIARGIETSYNVTTTEQQFLIAVGQYLLAINANDIKAAMLGH